MTLQQLRCVTEIAEKGSMSEAAKALYLSQPTLSATLRDLEQSLGFHIFVRNNRGMSLSPEGLEFLSYAKAVLTQEDLLENRYFGELKQKATLSISTQHYGFAAEAFLKLIKRYDPETFAISLKEQRTATIISDLKAFRSDLGIIYTDSKNEKMMLRYLKENHLEFNLLCETRPHVLISVKSPLAKCKSLSLSDLKGLTYLFFEQRDTDPLYFSEEILSSHHFDRTIGVSDRATIFTLLDNMDSFTVSSGMASKGIVEGTMASIPLDMDVTMKIGYIKIENLGLTPLAEEYLDILKTSLAN